jgi:regulatory protein
LKICYSMPMRITALQPQMKNPERINVFVDGHFALSVNMLIIERMALEVEQELSAEQLEELRSEAELQQALDRALNYLTYRPRSRQELRHYLRGKGTPPELIEIVLARLDRLEWRTASSSARAARMRYDRSCA